MREKENERKKKKNEKEKERKSNKGILVSLLKIRIESAKSKKAAKFAKTQNLWTLFLIQIGLFF